MNPLLPTRKTLWTLAEWRCEVDSLDRLRLFHGETMVAEQTTTSPELLQAYRQVWHAAIADIVEPANGATDDRVDRG